MVKIPANERCPTCQKQLLEKERDGQIIRCCSSCKYQHIKLVTGELSIDEQPFVTMENYIDQTSD